MSLPTHEFSALQGTSIELFSLNLGSKNERCNITHNFVIHLHDVSLCMVI